jgi:uncharacterized integral membrane protein
MAGNTAGKVATGNGQPRSPAARHRWPAVTPKRAAAVLISAAALWFILVNRATIGVYLWVPKVTAPLWLILLITFAAGLLTGLLLRRGRKERQQQ